MKKNLKPFQICHYKLISHHYKNPVTCNASIKPTPEAASSCGIFSKSIYFCIIVIVLAILYYYLKKMYWSNRKKADKDPDFVTIYQFEINE